MSDITLWMAVSVEWYVLYADCRSGINLLTLRYLRSRLQTNRSRDFDNTDKLILISDGKTAKIRFRLGLCPRHRWGSLQRSPKPIAGEEGAGGPLPKNPTSLSALRATIFGPSGLDTSSHGYNDSPRSRGARIKTEPDKHFGNANVLRWTFLKILRSDTGFVDGIGIHRIRRQSGRNYFTVQTFFFKLAQLMLSYRHGHRCIFINPTQPIKFTPNPNHFMLLSDPTQPTHQTRVIMTKIHISFVFVQASLIHKIQLAATVMHEKLVTNEHE